MPGTLILIFHKDLSTSKANAALRSAAAALPDVEIVDVQSEHPDDRIEMFADTDIHVARLLGADRIVLQFPVQWYSVPSLMKSWLDAVLTRMYYINADTEGARLDGTPLMITVTAGNVPEAYSSGGQAGFGMRDILTPLRATAHRCGLPLADPFVVYRSNERDADGLREAGEAYVAVLRDWIAATPSCG